MSDKGARSCDIIILVLLCLLFFVLPFAKAAIITFSWMAFAAWLVKKIFFARPKGSDFLEPFPHRFLIFFLLVNVIAVFTSVDSGASLKALMGKVLRYAAVYFLAYEVFRDRKRLQILAIAASATAVMIIADALFQYATGHDFLRRYPYIELTASFSSGNAFAGWLLIMFFAFAGIYFLARRQGRKAPAIFSAIASAIFLLFLFFTRSGGALLGFVVASLVFFHLTIKRFSHRTKILLFLFLVVSLACIKLTAVTEGTIMERTRLWKESLEIIEDFPILGIGPNTYAAVARQYKLFPEGGIYPHNSFLHMTAELGLVGVAFFLIFLASFYRFAISALSKKDSPVLAGLVAGTSGFLIQSFFDTHLYSMQMATLFWFIAGLTVAIAHKASSS